MFLKSLIFFFIKSLQRFKKDFLIYLSLVTVDTLFIFFSFAAIVPFAQFLVDSELKDPNKLTVAALFFLQKINISPSYLSLAMLFITTFTVSSILSLNVKYQTEKIKFSFEKTLTNDILIAVLNCKWSHLGNLHQGKILNIFSTELPLVGTSTRLLAEIFSSLCKLVIYLFVPFLIDAKFTATVIVMILAVGLPFLYFNKLATQLGTARMKATSRAIDYLSETYQAMKLILGFNLSKQTVDKNLDLTKKHIKETLKFHYLDYSVSHLYKPAAIIIVLISFGNSFELEKISTYIVLFWGLYGSIPLISSIINSSLSVSNFYPGYKQIYDVIENCKKFKENDKGKNFENLNKDIKFKNVSFHYIDSNPILKDCNILIPSKKITTFVGKTGIGKSTLIDLLIGFQIPISGEIFYDDTSIKEFNIKSLREKIGYVPQDPFLFNTSIRKNIMWGNPSVNENEIYNLLSEINAKNFVENSPQKLETIVGERGLKVSGGQRQKIALARALVRKPEILILDESLSSMDVNSSEIINKYLKELSKKITIINITHKIEHTKYSDKVILVKDNQYKEVSNITTY